MTVELRLVGGARVRFTTRADGNLGGSGEAGPEVLASRSRLLETCGVGSLAAGHQIHGAHVAVVSDAPSGYVVAREPADGQATRLPGVAVAVHVADCLPIALAGDGGVAVVHAGWRGLAGGVIAAGVLALRELGVTGPIEAAIGPGRGAVATRPVQRCARRSAARTFPVRVVGSTSRRSPGASSWRLGSAMSATSGSARCAPSREWSSHTAGTVPARVARRGLCGGRWGTETDLGRAPYP